MGSIPVISNRCFEASVEDDDDLHPLDKVAKQLHDDRQKKNVSNTNHQEQSHIYIIRSPLRTHSDSTYYPRRPVPRTRRIQSISFPTQRQNTKHRSAKHRSTKQRSTKQSRNSKRKVRSFSVYCKRVNKDIDERYQRLQKEYQLLTKKRKEYNDDFIKQYGGYFQQQSSFPVPRMDRAFSTPLSIIRESW